MGFEGTDSFYLRIGGSVGWGVGGSVDDEVVREICNGVGSYGVDEFESGNSGKFELKVWYEIGSENGSSADKYVKDEVSEGVDESVGWDVDRGVGVEFGYGIGGGFGSGVGG